MNIRNTRKLLNKYPKIFAQHSLSMQETAMCWLFECGDGWYRLIDILCSLLQWDIDHNKHEQLEATQVKEKYGTLRFYTNGNDDTQSGMIGFAEYISRYICESCGSTDGVTQTKGWIVTLCKKCMEDRNGRKNL